MTEMLDVLNRESTPRLHVIDEPPLPAAVERMLAALVREWSRTRDICLDRAMVLEALAADLRQRADRLDMALNSLPGEVEGCVQFEMDARRKASTFATLG